MDAGDLELRNATYARFVELGRAPRPDEVGDEADVLDAWRRLHDAHALVLDGSRTRLRMANPFSAVPTPHRVRANGRWWYANCAWDAFGILAALHGSGQDAHGAGSASASRGSGDDAHGAGSASASRGSGDDAHGAGSASASRRWDGGIESSCPDCAEVIWIEVERGRPRDDVYAHFLVPARSWWDDIVFT